MSRQTMDRLSILQNKNKGRMSMLLNEDDYDYALELRPDDEYRQAAEALPKLVDFDDIDLSEICEEHQYSENNGNIQPFSTTKKIRETTEFNTQRNRHSNFDQSMLELHTSKKPPIRSSIANYNTRTSIVNDDNLSHWGAVDTTRDNGNPTGVESLETDDLEACNFEPSDDEDEENIPEETQYDRRITGMGTGLLSNAALGDGTGINFHATTSSNGSTFSSRWRKLSKKEFSFRLNLLEKHRKWVERAARRSSIGFHRHHPSSDKEAMDKFLVAMAGGVHVRRHQAYRVSEVVRLYSVTGCRTIEWDKPKARELLLQRRKHNVHMEGSTNAAFSTKYDKSAFDCCIAICGCGDDLHTGHDPHNHTDAANMYNEDGADEARYSSFGRTFYNIGYRRRGTFRDLDVLAVHPAGKEDPTMLGMLGTECLRRTKDAYNLEMTFSVVVRDTSSSQGYSTLDVECETADMYYLLLRGFRLLQEEAESHRGLQRASGGSADDLDLEAGGDRLNNNLFSTKSSDGFLQLQRIDEISALWNSVKGYITRGAWEKSAAPTDPISELFAPSSQLDPLRAFRVGGGLLSVHTTPKSPPTSTHNNNSSTLNSPTSPISPPHTTTTTAAGSGSVNKSIPIAQFLGWNSAGTQIWARLKMAGLDVKCVLSWDLERVILKIRCPNWRLEQMAEQMHIKLKTRDGYLKQFKVSRRDTFAALGNNGAVFRSSERQQIIDYIIRSKIKDGGAELDENTELGKQIVQRFPLHMYSKLNDIKHSWVTFWKREAYGTEVKTWSPFTVPYKVTYNQMKISMEYFWNNLLTQPLDSIAEYFGEHIAFYFAYMAFYTRWLVFPSILGVIVFIVQMYENRLDHWLCPIYAIVVMIWACFMLAFWRQKASALAHRWGVLDYEVEETERPQFRGNYTYDESSGEVRKTYSLWKRTGKYVISIPVLAIAIIITLVIMTTVFYSQDEMYNDYLAGNRVDFQPKFPNLYGHSGNLGVNSTIYSSSNSNNNTTSGMDNETVRSFTISELTNSSFWAATFFYPCMYGIIVSILTIIFEFIAIWLNDFENHRTQTTYMNRLILKVFSFQFVTIFTSLYYYAFFISNHETAFFQISITVFSLMTVGQWWTMFLDIILPSLYHRALLYRMKSAFASTNRKIYYAKEYTDYKIKKTIKNNIKNNENNKEKRKNSDNQSNYTELINEKLQKRSEFLSQAKSKCWEEALQARYNNFSDYTSMIIQIGFVLFFSAVFPLCPLIALINNILLIRMNAYKICYTRQRPIAQKIGGIGVWEDVLQIMSVGGILTNCALYGFTSAQIKNILYPTIGKTGMAILLFAYEHTILLFKYWLHSSIPTIHPSVQRARTRERKSLNRKSILRNQTAAKTNYGGNAVGGGDRDRDPGNNQKPSEGLVASATKPLRAQGSMLGYWFDLSTRTAGGQPQQQREYTEEQQYIEEAEQGGVQLLAHVGGEVSQEGATVHRGRMSTVTAEWDHKSDESDSNSEGNDQDLPPSDEDEDGATSMHPSERNIGRELLLQVDEDSLPPPEEEENEVFYSQPFTTTRSSHSPQRARSPNPTTLEAAVYARYSGVGTGKPSERRSLSPNSRSRPCTPPPATALVPATRDQMINMIHANINNSILTPVVHTTTAPTVSRRVSFISDQPYPVTSQPESIHYLPANPQSEQSDSDEYDFSDDNVSDLSDEADDYEDPNRGEHHSNSDAWNMTFTSETSQKIRSNSAQTKRNPIKNTTTNITTATTKQKKQQQQSPRPKSNKTTAATSHHSSTTKPTVTKKTGATNAPTTTPGAPAPSGGVQELLSHWFWPSSAHKPTNNTTAKVPASTSTATGRKNSLNLAPLGQKKNSPRATAKADVKPPLSGPISSPPSAALKFQEATSPYAALLTPPIVIGPSSETPRDTDYSSPQRARRAAVTNTNTTTAPPSYSLAQGKDSQKKKVKAEFISPQIKSPFSYTDEAPTTPSVAREVCKENDRILANLQTGQLQQLLLLQQQQQQQQTSTPPKKITKPKQVSTPTSAPKQQQVSSTTSSPVRSAIAGSRQKQQQLLTTQLTALGWQPASNPYEHIISPGGTPVRADTHYHEPTTQAPPPLSLQHPSTTPGKSSRSGRQPVNSSIVRTVDATEQPPTQTPRRRISTTTPRKSISRHTLELSTATDTATPTNPFLYASNKKRPERLVYD